MQKIRAAIFAVLLCASAKSQSGFLLPDLDSLRISIDLYYSELSASQIEEHQQSAKGRWMNYLPSPGYSPFQGGFTLSLNITAPLQEIKLNKQTAAKIRSIQRLNDMQAQILKNEITADYTTLEMMIEEYNSKEGIEKLKRQAFDLVQKQYQRNELTPSDYLAKETEYQTFVATRLAERNNIYRAINNLLLKARKPVHANAPASLASSLKQ